MALLLGYDVGSSSIKAAVVEGETCRVLVSAICPKKEQAAGKCRERIAFWKVMKWATPIFVAILLTLAVLFLTLYTHMLTSFTKPIGEMKVEIEHLHKENTGLKIETERLQQKLSGVKERMAKMEVEIEHLGGRNTRLENLAEKQTDKKRNHRE